LLSLFNDETGFLVKIIILKRIAFLNMTIVASGDFSLGKGNVIYQEPVFF